MMPEREVSKATLSYLERLAEAQSHASKARQDPSRWPFREAAAVLSHFSPDTLRPVNYAENPLTHWEDFLTDCEPVPADRGGSWQLRADMRREALRRLGSRERMLKALRANPDRSDDELQRKLTAVISGDSLENLATMSREELIAVSTVRDWLGNILDGLPRDAEIRRALEIAESLDPFRRLAGGDHFVGRTKKLEILREHVGVCVSKSLGQRAWRFIRESYYDLTIRPPLMISGPGDIGKSSLVARFILDHSEDFASKNALPFVYLDLDRAALDPLQPMSLVAEAAQQLTVEWPHLKKDLEEVVARIRLPQSAETSMFENSRDRSRREITMVKFGDLLEYGSEKRPVLFVIDTFEEAQFLGFDVVLGIGQLLAELQGAAPMLRIVLAGRATLEQETQVLPTKNVRLDDLSLEDARELLLRNITNNGTLYDSNLLDETVNLVGRSPLSLKLASQILSQHGIQDLRNVGRRNRLLLRVKSEIVQSRLYGRILAHVHDDEVKSSSSPVSSCAGSPRM